MRSQILSISPVSANFSRGTSLGHALIDCCLATLNTGGNSPRAGFCITNGSSIGRMPFLNVSVDQVLRSIEILLPETGFFLSLFTLFVSYLIGLVNY